MKKPRLKALETFEAVSRHLSVSRAAEELGVSQTAVSHQLRHLTSEIGEKLYEKAGRGISLTDAGMQLSRKLQNAFREINLSVSEAVGSHRHVLRLAVCTSFAPAWLVPRLGSFLSAYPDIDLQILTYSEDPHLTDHVADAFVTTLPTEPGFWAMRLWSELLVPVYLASEIPLDERRLRLITTCLDAGRLGDDWIDYCRTAEIALETLHAGSWLQVSHYTTALDMARHGLGVAMVPDFLAEPLLGSGVLESLSSHKLATHEDYYLCMKDSRRSERHLRSLTMWFRGQLSGKHTPG
ncbi:MAG: LysR family transcriptional regulator [Mesorhizobium sp.]|uniref:LysR family transcriptional regulator n=1 Tax=Mesorhizobium sp. TaxID=1871066 RepID=UPI001AC74621|nr:LysR substrate-binding domain-containing protein [Mesorhizobium sp.]MBN9216602.1 LysR family transcriptional regulator [Mesorhizobium sp.]